MRRALWKIRSSSLNAWLGIESLDHFISVNTFDDDSLDILIPVQGMMCPETGDGRLEAIKSIQFHQWDHNMCHCLHSGWVGMLGVLGGPFLFAVLQEEQMESQDCLDFVFCE